MPAWGLSCESLSVLVSVPVCEPVCLCLSITKGFALSIEQHRKHHIGRNE